MATPDPIEDTGPETVADRKPFLTLPQWLLFGGLLAVVITLSVAVTVMLFQPATTMARDSQAHVVAQIGALEDRMTYYERQLNQMSATLNEVAERQTAAEEANIPPALLERLLDQEADLQQFITALKQGMRELSHMVHGSRDWLELYSEELDQVRDKSQSRARALENRLEQ